MVNELGDNAKMGLFAANDVVPVTCGQKAILQFSPGCKACTKGLPLENQRARKDDLSGLVEW